VPVSPLHRHQPCASALIFIRPARSARSSQPVGCLAASCAAGQGSARPPAPSVLVVPPDFDGLLRTSPCGLVASRSRPWGSSRFQIPAADREWDMGISHATRGASARDLFPGTHNPSKPFPCTQPSYACGATEIAPSPFVDARLTDLSAPLGTTGSLRVTEARILAVHGRASPLAVAAPPLLTASVTALIEGSCEPSCEPDIDGAPGATTRPQGLPPRTDPLHRPDVAARPVPDASMGFLLCTHRPRGPPPKRPPPKRWKVDRLQRFCCVASVAKRSHPGPT
jgi:hypothetical protein